MQTTTYAPLRSPRVKRVLQRIGDEMYHLPSVIARHRKAIEERKDIVLMQLVALCIVGLSFGMAVAINIAWPGFFSYPYFEWEVRYEEVVRFWPLLIWCLVLCTADFLFGGRLHSSHLDNELLRWGLVSGNLAAVWEELGFRGAFVCFGMISVLFLNWILGTGAVWALSLFLGFVAFTMLFSEKGPNAFAVVPAALAILCFFGAGVVDPLFWLYQNVLMPLLNTMSFGSYTEIINPELHEPLFVMGAIVANGWFRDGHKYQGIVGLLDSWLIGFVLLYAMMTYGLLTAIVLHALWNTLVHTVMYLRRKYRQLTD